MSNALVELDALQREGERKISGNCFCSIRPPSVFDLYIQWSPAAVQRQQKTEQYLDLNCAPNDLLRNPGENNSQLITVSGTAFSLFPCVISSYSWETHRVSEMKPRETEAIQSFEMISRKEALIRRRIGGTVMAGAAAAWVLLGVKSLSLAWWSVIVGSGIGLYRTGSSSQ